MSATPQAVDVVILDEAEAHIGDVDEVLDITGAKGAEA